jgi:ABC-2 type transport system permease protein
MNRAFAIGAMTARQILGAKRFVGLGVLSAAPGAIFFLASRQSTGRGLLDMFAGFTIGFFFSIAIPVIALIMAGSALGDERRDGTLSFIVLRPISRYQIAAAKLGGALAASFGIVAAGAVVLTLVMGVRSSEWGYLAPMIIGAFIATALYVAVFLPLGYLTERTTLIGLAFVFIWESAIVGTLPGLAATSPWRTGFVAYMALAPDALVPLVPDWAFGDLVPGAGGSAVKMLVVLAAATAITGWILRRRDLI